MNPGGAGEAPAVDGDTVDGIDRPRRMTRSTAAISLLAIVLLGLVLYLPGVWWGLPATTSWSQDTIAGYRTLGALEHRSAHWQGRYPPLHYHVLGAFYQPILRHWAETGERIADPQTGAVDLVEPHAPKIGWLLLVARLVSVAMAIAGAVGLWLAARLLTGSNTAALVATTAFMLNAAYTYFAQTGNVDVPAICWFTWSVYFFARSLRSRRAIDAGLLGLFGAAAISTKDSLAGLYPGMAITLLLIEWTHQRECAVRAGLPSPGWAFVRSFLQWKWLLGVVLFVGPYLWLYGALDDLDWYRHRMEYWLTPDPGSLHARQLRYASQPALLLATFRYAAGAVGWPMLAAMVGSAMYALRSQRWLLLCVGAPVLTYFLVVISQIQFVYSRFLLGPMALLCILVGSASVALWRRNTWPTFVRAGVLCAIALPTVGYAAGVSLAKHRDTRYAAEAWFREHVDPPSSVGAFSNPQYLPRLHDQGYATYPVKMERASFDQPQPEYLILTSYNHEDFDSMQRMCMLDLLAGSLGYQQVAAFEVDAGHVSEWLGLAAWGAPAIGKISPTITVLKRE